MDLKTLKTFQAIVHYGSFNRVAEAMNYAQSTVTMQIQKLESDLGVQLFERGKRVSLTEAGRLFYEQSLPIIKQMEKLQSDISDLKGGEAGNIRLGVTEPTASYRLPVILKRFLSQYPKIRIALDIAGTPALSERLLRGELDLALCSTPELGSTLYFEPLLKETFVVLMPEHHPLAQKAVIAPRDIQEYRLLITSATCPYRRKLEMVLQESGCLSLDTMEIGSMTALKHYVASRLGIALVPKIVTESIPDGTTIRALTGPLVDMPFGLLCRSADYPLKQASLKLYQFLKEELSDKE